VLRDPHTDDGDEQRYEDDDGLHGGADVLFDFFHNVNDLSFVFW
jgi:hypothetical protein